MKKAIYLLFCCLCAFSLWAEDIHSIKIIRYDQDPRGLDFSCWQGSSMHGLTAFCGADKILTDYHLDPDWSKTRTLGKRFEVNVRYGFYDSQHQLRLLSSVFRYEIFDGGFNNVSGVCRMDLPAGVYDLRMLVQIPGDDYWIYVKCPDEGNEEFAGFIPTFRFVVEENPGVPFCGEFNTSMITVYEGDPFAMSAVLRNDLDRPIRGSLKAIWGYQPVEFDSYNWDHGIESFAVNIAMNALCNKRASDTLGEFPITIGAKQTLFVEIENCACDRVFYRDMDRDLGMRVPLVHFYFKPEGSDKWFLVQEDCRKLLSSDGSYNPRFMSIGLNYTIVEAYERPMADSGANLFTLRYTPQTKTLEIMGIDPDVEVKCYNESYLREKEYDPQFGVISTSRKGDTVSCTVGTNYRLYVELSGKINKIIPIDL